MFYFSTTVPNNDFTFYYRTGHLSTLQRLRTKDSPCILQVHRYSDTSISWHRVIAVYDQQLDDGETKNRLRDK